MMIDSDYEGFTVNETSHSTSKGIHDWLTYEEETPVAEEFTKEDTVITAWELLVLLLP